MIVKTRVTSDTAYFVDFFLKKEEKSVGIQINTISQKVSVTRQTQWQIAETIYQAIGIYHGKQ